MTKPWPLLLAVGGRRGAHLGFRALLLAAPPRTLRWVAQVQRRRILDLEAEVAQLRADLERFATGDDDRAGSGPLFLPLKDEGTWMP